MELFRNYIKFDIHFFAAHALIIAATFTFSLYLAPYHTGGDQEHYSNAYSAMQGLSLIDAYELYPTIIHTVEPAHFFIIWMFSSIGVEKNVLMAVANSLLATLFFSALRIKGNPLPLALLLLFSNYYLMTMFFTLERTKFAFIFFLIYLQNKRLKYIALAIFSHILVLIPIVSHFLANYLATPKESSSLKKESSALKWLKMTALLAVLFYIFDFFGAHISDKFAAYAQEKQLTNTVDGWQIFLILAFTFLSSNSKKVPLIYFVILLALTSQIGGARVNMLAYFGFLFYSSPSNKNYKFFAFLLAIYFSYKCYIYADVIVNLGG